MFVLFPEEEKGKRRKLSRLWYGPFGVIARQDADLTVRKVYFPEESPFTVHQLRVCLSPDMLRLYFIGTEPSEGAQDVHQHGFSGY